MTLSQKKGIIYCVRDWGETEMWLDRLDKNSTVVSGRKQTLRAIRNGQTTTVFIAKDAQQELIAEIEAACKAAGIECTYADSMRQLGAAAGIRVGASACAVLSST